MGGLARPSLVTPPVADKGKGRAEPSSPSGSWRDAQERGRDAHLRQELAGTFVSRPPRGGVLPHACAFALFPGGPQPGTWKPAGRTRKGPAHLLAGNSKATGRTCLGPAAYCQSADIGGSDPKVDGLPTLLPRTGTTEHDGEKGNKTRLPRPPLGAQCAAWFPVRRTPSPRRA